MGNAAVVERMFEAWTRGDTAVLVAHVDPEIDWVEPPETIGRNVVRGPEAALAALANWVEQFDSLEARTTDLRERGDRVLHGMEQRVRARGSSAEIVGPLYMVWWFRGDRAVRMEMYNDADEAEAAFER